MIGSCLIEGGGAGGISEDGDGGDALSPGVVLEADDRDFEDGGVTQEGALDVQRTYLVAAGPHEQVNFRSDSVQMWRGEGGHGKADILVREVAGCVNSVSVPNADKGGWKGVQKILRMLLMDAPLKPFKMFLKSSVSPVVAS